MVELRGGAFYDSESVYAQYAAGHEANRFSPTYVMEEPAVLAEVGDPAGLRVLDLGCGDGSFGRLLLNAGCAAYLGVDGSTRMIERANQNLAGTPGHAQLADLEDFRGEPASADLITARLSLHYLADLMPVLLAAFNALRPGGRLVFTVVHPVITCYDNKPAGPRTTWTVDDYFLPGPRTRPWLGSQVTWYHRTIEDYVRALCNTGFSVTAVRECEPVPDRFAGDTDELSRRRRVPLFLLLSGRSDGPQTAPASL